MRLTDIEVSIPAPIFLDGSERRKDGALDLTMGRIFSLVTLTVIPFLHTINCCNNLGGQGHNMSPVL